MTSKNSIDAPNASLATLPTELYTDILSHVPSSSSTHQQTTLALTRAIPRSPVPSQSLFPNIIIRRAEQVVLLDRRIRAGLAGVNHGPNRQGDSDSDTPAPEQPQPLLFDASPYVKSLDICVWDVDAEVLSNLLRNLPNLYDFALRVGPMNFTPAMLEGLFELDTLGKLKRLELRFRPYVQKATYLSFLKGSYFDSTLITLSHFPSGIPALSIVQDQDTSGPKTFAQPIVFHLLDQPLSLLLHSPGFSNSLKHLRLRIPNRPVVAPLTTVYAVNQREGGPEHGKIVPKIEVLDLSTSLARESDIETLLVRFLPTLRHLVLDDCPGLVRHAAGAGEDMSWWHALGRRCAVVGVKKAREREREVKVGMEGVRMRRLASEPSTALAHAQEETGDRGQGLGLQEGTRRPRQGRRGLATATVTLRGANVLAEAESEAERRVPIGLADLIRGGNGPLPRVHIVPPIPVLETIALSVGMRGSSGGGEEQRERMVREFEEGWRDGIRVVKERRERMGVSFRREREGNVNSRYYRFGKGGEVVVEVVDEGLFALAKADIPRLCLGGEKHVERCAHSVGEGLWNRCDD